jgi:MscS family membrane protein
MHLNKFIIPLDCSTGACSLFQGVLSTILPSAPLGGSYYRAFPIALFCWQILILTAIVALITFLYQITKSLLRRVLQQLAIRLSYSKLDNFANPLSIITIYIMSRSILPFLNLSESMLDKVLIGGEVLVVFFCVFSSYQFIDLITFYIVRQQTVAKKFHFNLILLPIVSVSLKVCASIIGAIKILQIFHFDIKGLLAGVGIGGLGFALASQDTIKNFFGSLVILTDKPFQIGDHIVSEQISGKVEEIGFRSTRIRTHQGYIIYAPNGKLADSCITNYGEKQYKAFETSIAIPYNIPIETIETFIEGLRKIVERCPIARAGKYAVCLYEMRDSILHIKFSVDFNVTEDKIELINRQNILLNIIKLARHLDVYLAFPTHKLEIENYQPEKFYGENKLYLKEVETGKGGLKKKLQDFFETNPF